MGGAKQLSAHVLIAVMLQKVEHSYIGVQSQRFDFVSCWGGHVVAGMVCQEGFQLVDLFCRGRRETLDAEL